MLLSDFVRTRSASLESLYPASEARNIVLDVCVELLGVTRYTHLVEPETPVPPERMPELAMAMMRLLAGEPLQYVLGHADFFGRRFRVTRATLIPRPETEELCRKALSLLPPTGRILDLCTGSGNIAWTLSLERPGTEAVAVDLSAEALEVAESQDFAAEMLLSRARAPRFVQADLLSDAYPEGFFDLLLSNPPYLLESERAAMRPNVRDYEPATALFVPDADPLRFYRAIARWAVHCLRPGGTGLVEINETLGPETAALFRDSGFEAVAVLPDLWEKSRFVHFRKPLFGGD